jgi:hypothetical protein
VRLDLTEHKGKCFDGLLGGPKWAALGGAASSPSVSHCHSRPARPSRRPAPGPIGRRPLPLARREPRRPARLGRPAACDSTWPSFTVGGLDGLLGGSKLAAPGRRSLFCLKSLSLRQCVTNNVRLITFIVTKTDYLFFLTLTMLAPTRTMSECSVYSHCITHSGSGTSLAAYKGGGASYRPHTRTSSQFAQARIEP